MKYNFDMDGTICGLYNVEGWEGLLDKKSVIPYEKAPLLVEKRQFEKAVNALKRKGEVNIISWASKNADEYSDYFNAIVEAKKQWLKENLDIEWDNIYIVPYGTPKKEVCNGILFDDEEKNRKLWGFGAYSEKDLVRTIESLITPPREKSRAILRRI